MDTLLYVVELLALAALFGGVLTWAFAGGRKERFEEGGRIPFQEWEADAQPCRTDAPTTGLPLWDPPVDGYRRFDDLLQLRLRAIAQTLRPKRRFLCVDESIPDRIRGDGVTITAPPAGRLTNTEETPCDSNRPRSRS